MALDNDRVFWDYVRARYKGKVYRIERTHDVELVNIVKVQIEVHIPIDEADELEMYRRVNSVLEVIADGEE